MRSAYLTLNVDRDAEAERIFSALSDGGEIFMPIHETFFATRFGQLGDRFGLNWMIIHERPMPPSCEGRQEVLVVDVPSRRILHAIPTNQAGSHMLGGETDPFRS